MWRIKDVKRFDKWKFKVVNMLYENVIYEFTAMSREIIGDKLTGIYLHGSMAMGCFNPEKSDIDLLIVIENDITDAQKMEFMKHVVKLNEQAPAKGLEISIVNSDLAAHFTIINRYGIVLYGEKIENVFGEVSKKDYAESIWFDVEGASEDIADEPMYITLNLCRVLAFLKEDLYLSKQQGGEWGIAHLSKRYHSLILQALDCYKTNHIMQADMELTGQFADEMLTSIKFENEKQR